jgi:hypothetical protein
MNNKDTIEARKYSDVVARITGERFCHSANHWTKAPTFLRRGRRICEPCKQRLIDLKKKRSSR